MASLGERIAQFLASRGRVNTIDDWLAQHRGPDVTCHVNSLEIYFPLEHPRSEEYARQILAAVVEAAGGATVWEGKGLWCDKEKDPLCQKVLDYAERVMVIKAAHSCMSREDAERVARALKEAMEGTEQSALGISGTNRFYVIPTSQIRA